jgi:hypothetical protein
MRPFELVYLLSNAFALAMLILAFVRPQWTRVGTIVLFFLAFTWNTRGAILDPVTYQGMGHFATVRWYHDFVFGWFADHTRLVLLPIAAGQLVIAVLLMGNWRWQRVGVMGATIFLLAVAPLGRVAAFPFSLTYIAAMWVMLLKLRSGAPDQNRPLP